MPHSSHTPTVEASLGPTLRAAREGAGVSIRTLAAQAGVSHTHLHRFELGERPISLNKYEHLLHALAALLPPTKDAA